MANYAYKILLTDPANYTNLQVGGGYINDNFASIFGAMAIDSAVPRVNFGSYDITNTDGWLAIKQLSNTFASLAYANNASFTSTVHYLQTVRASSDLFSFMRCYSGGGTDLEAWLKGNGDLLLDGAVTTGGADRGECLRWFDDNINNEDRMGLSVCYLNGRIYPASHVDVAHLEPIGIISATADSIGNASALRWHGKYEVDDFGRKQYEPYTQIEWVETVVGGEDINHSYQMDKVPTGVVVPTNAVSVSVDENNQPLMRPKLNPAFDPSLSYIPRLDRPEYDVVGMVGLVRMQKGQRTSVNWCVGEQISATVEEWLVK